MNKDEIKKLIEDEAAKQSIFEPKYGGKDHSGYDTLMKYEVNGYLEEYFEKGAMFTFELMDEYAKEVAIDFVKWANDDNWLIQSDKKWWNFQTELEQQVEVTTEELFELYLK
jgi:hypothetical protein